ncbi:hypothetical protein HN011_004789 [Eciton burchellii]|nr:hypothetical protein HN011_004789 [Eciton burchellii]
MSMPTKGKHHHLSHHHHQSHQHQQQQSHHAPPQHSIILNQPVVHSPQTYSAVVTTNTPRFLTNAGKSLFVDFILHSLDFSRYYPRLPSNWQ